MPRLYFRFYIALLGSLLLFAFAVTLLWHCAGGPVERADAAGQLVQNMLPPVVAPPAEQQAALSAWPRASTAT